jgi:hypothetical protein
MSRAFALPLLLALAACGQAPMPPPAAGEAPRDDAPAPSDMAAKPALPPPELAAPALPVAEDWLGIWQGPEGTSLQIAKQEAGYDVTITNLDGTRVFEGTASGDALQFERDGKTETVRAGDGQATGMKWLAEKKDCLVVKAGEGYCRD